MGLDTNFGMGFLQRNKPFMQKSKPNDFGLNINQWLVVC